MSVESTVVHTACPTTYMAWQALFVALGMFLGTIETDA